MVLCPVIGKLLHKRVVLASASPRRQEILSNAGLRFEVVPSRFKEKLDKASFATPYGYAMETAKQKALEVATRMHQARGPCPSVPMKIPLRSGLILRAGGQAGRYRMLSRLSGKEHSVFTGVAIVHCSSNDRQLHTRVSEFYEETTVKFSELSEELLWEYIHSGEPMDKAGGYGIQALGGMLVESVHGDFLNVVGFPLNHFCKQLVELYYPPRPEDLRQPVQHDSIPAVDTFEDLGDVEGGGSEPAQRETGSCDEKAEARAAGRATAEAECHRTRATLPPFPTRLLELLDGFKLSKALLTACKLKVFDWLKDEAPQKAPDIASKVDASVCGTEKLLDVCAAMGLLEKTEQGYSNTETANLYLASDSEYSLHGFMLQNNDVIWNLFTYLEFAIREGRNQHHRVLGKKVEDLFQDAYYRSPETQLRFMQAMHGVAKLTARQVATAFDLSRFSSACDVGGGYRKKEEYSLYPWARRISCRFVLPHVAQSGYKVAPLIVYTSPWQEGEGEYSDTPGLEGFPAGLHVRWLESWPRALHGSPGDRGLTSRRRAELAARASAWPGPQAAGIHLAARLCMCLRPEEGGRGGLIQPPGNMLVQTEGRERSRGEY
nr:probable bifunctional dTTP/UTP pyrophosphatase/methyltransferase protein [Chlorocebus sabaeus]